jgi:23S rRNA (uracil1939-C5)-methyltransferase
MDYPKNTSPDPHEVPGALKIERVVAGGDGIARHGDGRVVFVPRTAPGEQVEVRYTEEHRQWLRARLVRVVEPSPHRRAAACPYYDACGGCQLQHLDYDTQLSVKAEIVADSLRRLGGFDVGAPGIVASPREFEYRNRIGLVLRRHPGGSVVGYHMFDNPSRLLAVDQCPLADRSINDAWSNIADTLERIGDLAPVDAEWRLTFRASSKGEVGLTIEGPDRPQRIRRSVVESLIDKGLVAVWTVNDEGRIIAHAGAESLAETWGAYEIPLAGTVFVQANREAAELLDACVYEECRVVAGDRVVDAYCGFGLRTFELARAGASVVGIDYDRHAIRAATGIGTEKNLPVRFVAERVENALAQELPADTVILNPPRSGIDPDVVAALLGHPPDRIIYVSCNPATLARDLRGLAPRFAPETVKAYDLFPQTAHVEAVVTLTRRPPESPV